MSQLEFMPVGIDPGIDGGIVGIHEREIAYFALTPPVNVKYKQLETDAVKRKMAKSKSKKAGKRYKKTRELTPKQRSVFDAELMQQCLSDAVSAAVDRGYLGVFIAVEKMITMIGGESRADTMVAGGRCQNAWSMALSRRNLRWGEIAPSSWKAALKATSDKDVSVAMAHELFDLPAEVAASHDLCEAALLAHYLRECCPRYLKV